MNPLSSATTNPGRFRRPRYFAVTYYAGTEALPGGRQHVYRSRKLNRARSIATRNMPSEADTMEFTEISRREFHRRRAERQAALGRQEPDQIE